MAKRTLLSEVIKTKPTPSTTGAPPPSLNVVNTGTDKDSVVAPPAKEPKRAEKPSRIGTRMLAFHVPEAVYRQFKIMAAEEGRTVHDMMRESVNDTFAKYGKETIA